MKQLEEKRTIFILLFLALAIVSQCQRGRGGGGGGGGSSGRSGGSSFRGSYGGSSYYGTGSSSSGETIGIIFGSICTTLCCLGIISLDWRSLFRMLFNRDDKQNADAQFEILKSVKNKVSPIIMTNKQYEKIKNQFIAMISNSDSVFEYTQNGQSTRIYNTTVKEFPEESFIERILLTGSDEVGSWTGRGFFLASVEGPFVWWMKEYADKQAAGQTGDSQFLIYQSTSYDLGKWQGRWYYQGDENDLIYSGTWSLKGAQNQFVDSQPQLKEDRSNPFDVLADHARQLQ